MPFWLKPFWLKALAELLLIDFSSISCVAEGYAPLRWALGATEGEHRKRGPPVADPDAETQEEKEEPELFGGDDDEMAADGAAILAAIGALRGDVQNSSTKVDNLNTKIDGMSVKIDANTNDIRELQREVTVLKQKQDQPSSRSAAPSDGGSIAGSIRSLGASTIGASRGSYSYAAPQQCPPDTDLDAVLSFQYSLPVKRRRVLVIGGFPPQSSSEDLMPTLSAIKDQDNSILKIFPTARLTNRAKALFKSNNDAWAFLKRFKNHGLSYNDGPHVMPLWQGLDKTTEEQTISKRASYLHGQVKEIMLRAGIIASDDKTTVSKFLDANWDTGAVWVKKVLANRTFGSNVILARMPKDTMEFVATPTGAVDAGITGLSKETLEKFIQEANVLEVGGGGGP